MSWFTRNREPMPSQYENYDDYLDAHERWLEECDRAIEAAEERYYEAKYGGKPC